MFCLVEGYTTASPCRTARYTFFTYRKSVFTGQNLGDVVGGIDVASVSMLAGHVIGGVIGSIGILSVSIKAVYVLGGVIGGIYVPSMNMSVWPRSRWHDWHH